MNTGTAFVYKAANMTEGQRLVEVLESKGVSAFVSQIEDFMPHRARFALPASYSTEIYVQDHQKEMAIRIIEAFLEENDPLTTEERLSFNEARNEYNNKMQQSKSALGILIIIMFLGVFIVIGMSLMQ